MSGALAVWRRELIGLFCSPLAWALLFIALLVNGLLFELYLVRLSGGEVDFAVRHALGRSWMFWTLLVLLPPLLTMRMISEEVRSGQLEFLLTAPVTDLAVVSGKFLAALSFMALLWASLFLYAAALASAGAAPDLGLLLGGWLGAVLASGLFCALGLLASALTATPAVAAFAAVVASVVLLILPQLAQLSDVPWLRQAVARVDIVDHHASSFLMGVLDSSYAVFFLAWTAVLLFLAVRAVEARRWR